MKDIYFLGGSPCSGKSTFAEMIAEKYDMYYFKIDDYLDKYTELGAKDDIALIKKLQMMTIDEMWLRDPRKQSLDEVVFYQEIFNYIMYDLDKLPKDKKIITEGAALMPCLMCEHEVDTSKYICIVPEREFQIEKYSKREWVDDYLSSSSDKQKAFENWMERDILFAQYVLRDCQRYGYESLIVDDSKSLAENFKVVERVLKLGEL
ncbi:hypothetical protein LJC10_03965 [Selenomonadales bacterium OttesenSCG-928-I06]|nr:hypothetical protein [Selenomonadales bacterium OttesenSCG-928-I06]